jgi:mRNA interferase MazF
VQDDRFVASLPTVMIVPFTSALGATRFDGTVLIQPDAANGLTVSSVALVFQLRALDKRDFMQRLGVLDAATLQRIYQLLDQLTGR